MLMRIHIGAFNMSATACGGRFHRSTHLRYQATAGGRVERVGGCVCNSDVAVYRQVAHHSSVVISRTGANV